MPIYIYKTYCFLNIYKNIYYVLSEYIGHTEVRIVL